MFRLQGVNSCFRRLLHSGTLNRDMVLEQLQVCCNEDHVFYVVGKNKAKLTVDHVSKAVGMLWQFQKEKTEMFRSLDFIKSHPQFLTLRVLAENKIVLMDDLMLVETLYSFVRLKVDPCDSLIQQLVSEAWLRLDKLPLNSLSMFSNCLGKQLLHHSPLMGQITNILATNLQAIDDARILTNFMISVSSLVSPRLRDALIAKVYVLLDLMNQSSYNDARRAIQFLRNVKYIHQPLIEKCNEILMRSIHRKNAEDIAIVLGVNQSLHFSNYDFKLAAKQRLTELIDLSTDPFTFTKLFCTLSPLAGPEMREGLENTALLLADEFNAQQALFVADALGKTESRNLSLIKKIAAVIQKNLHVYKSVEVARITQTLFFLQYQNPDLYGELKTILTNFLQDSFFPYEVTMLTHVLSLLPTPHVDESLISRIEAVVPQCTLHDLSTLANVVAKWLCSDSSYRYSTPSKYVHLLQVLSRYGKERLQTAHRLDLLIEELKFVSGEWFEEILTEDVKMTLETMMDQITATDAPELCRFIKRINLLSPPLMEHIANVVVKDIDKIHYSATYSTLCPFSDLNYDSDKAEEMYNACIQHFTPHIGSFDPFLLLLLGYSLAVANYFPEELIKEIFSIDFLEKLDLHLQSHPEVNNLARKRLMQLNRAVCLDCPEYQVPWFHESYCQRFLYKGNGPVNRVQQQIHKMLGDVLGGINYVKIAVVTPYFYKVDFECTLDKKLKAVPYYTDPGSVQIPDGGQLQWGAESPSAMRNELPPDAQKVAVDFLDSKSFCKRSRHMTGEALIRKRHLEMLGYCVVQIPYFEWNSMELSTEDAWKDYLKRKILGKFST